MTGPVTRLRKSFPNASVRGACGDENVGMDERISDDLATLWFLSTGEHCIIRACGADWHVRVEQNGVTVRDRTFPNSRTALAVAGEWETEFKGGEVQRTGGWVRAS